MAHDIFDGDKVAAYHEGQMAALHGEPRASNTYTGGELFEMWIAGWEWVAYDSAERRNR